MDSSQAGTGQLVAGAGGAVLIIALFLAWAGNDGPSVSGWELERMADIFFLITGLVAIGAAVTGGRDDLIPGLSLGGAATLLGAVSVVLLLWLLLFDFPDGASRKLGAWLALLAAIAIAAGGYMAAQEDRPTASPQ